MDGHFVPSLTFGPGVVRAIRPLDQHALGRPHDGRVARALRRRDSGRRARTSSRCTSRRALTCTASWSRSGSAARGPVWPSTRRRPLRRSRRCCPTSTRCWPMTVNPGFGGQPFIETMVGKIGRLRKALDERGLDAELEVDGGIKPGNARLAAQAAPASSSPALPSTMPEPRSPTPSRPSAPRPRAAPDIGGPARASRPPVRHWLLGYASRVVASERGRVRQTGHIPVSPVDMSRSLSEPPSLSRP